MKANIKNLLSEYEQRVIEIESEIEKEIKSGVLLNIKSQDYLLYCLNIKRLKTEKNTLDRVIRDIEYIIKD